MRKKSGEDVEFILTYVNAKNNDYRQLCHASNLLGKWHGNRLSSKQTDALFDILEQYYIYLRGNLDISGFSKSVIEKRVALLNDYYNFYNENNYDNTFTSQGKFRPTILEEFMFLLFKDYVEYLKKKFHDDGDIIDSGAAKAYTNLYFTSNNFESFVKSPSIEINVKDQDFAIFRNFKLVINDATKDIRIPIIAIENKTYIDKTMLEGIISTAEKIKTGNPYAMFIAVAENYDVDLGVDPAYSRINQIYVLRKCKRKEAWADIDAKVVWRLFSEVKEHIERPWSDVESKMRNEGVIL